MFDEVSNLSEKWHNSRNTFKVDLFTKDEFDKLNSDQKVMFFNNLALKEVPLPLQLLKAMRKVYDLSQIKNSEVNCKWLLLSLSGKYLEVMDDVILFVTNIGRMKYVRPIYKYFYFNYRAMNKVDPKLAKETFLKHASFYHPICANMVRKDLGIM
jgi:leukotriene-A4 hydrolase